MHRNSINVYLIRKLTISKPEKIWGAFDAGHFQQPSNFRGSKSRAGRSLGLDLLAMPLKVATSAKGQH